MGYLWRRVDRIDKGILGGPRNQCSLMTPFPKKMKFYSIEPFFFLISRLQKWLIRQKINELLKILKIQTLNLLNLFNNHAIMTHLLSHYTHFICKLFKWETEKRRRKSDTKIFVTEEKTTC